MNLSKKQSVYGGHLIWCSVFLMLLMLTSAASAASGNTKKPTLSVDPILKHWGTTNSISNAVYVVTGKASAKNNDSIAQVYYNVNGGAWMPATTWNEWYDWSANVTLDPGKNTIEVYAEDSSGNTSNHKKIKLTYYVSQPNLFYPIQITMVVSNNNQAVEFITFSTNTFSELTGVGTYTYKRINPLTGKLSIKYTAPPSAVGHQNDVKLTMDYDVYYAGTFKEDSQSTFILYETENLSPPALTDSQLTFTNSSGVETVMRFPKQPSLGSNEGLHHAPNPWNLELGSPYPGQIGDRVSVAIKQTRKQNGGVKTLRTTQDAGTVIGVNSNQVSVLFDSPYYEKSEDVFTPVGISIISYYYNTFEGGTPIITNGTGTFTYTNYTWAGSLLNLQQDGMDKYLILTFTNDTSSGFFYDETELSNGGNTTDYGFFSLALPPLITSDPQNTAATNGGSASFSVQAAGTPVLTYQWQFNGTNLADGATGTGSTISGSTTTNLTIDNISPSDFGNYRVVVSNDLGTATSSNATLELAVPPAITSQPQNVSATAGNTASFSVTAGGSEPLHYQWQANGINLYDGGNIFGSTVAGSTNANLTISNVHVSDSGTYQVIITNSFGSVTSSIANLNVNIGP